MMIRKKLRFVNLRMAPRNGRPQRKDAAEARPPSRLGLRRAPQSDGKLKPAAQTGVMSVAKN
jgi:hypothetical protein